METPDDNPGYWITTGWKCDDLEGKSVEFCFPDATGQIAEGKGVFSVRENGDTHQLEIAILLEWESPPGTGVATRHYLV
ncbi:MAG: hypothetical protein ABR611_15280 [Chthoniobacterales bacterium]